MRLRFDLNIEHRFLLSLRREKLRFQMLGIIDRLEGFWRFLKFVALRRKHWSIRLLGYGCL
jgi:hypothetical protein